MPRSRAFRKSAQFWADGDCKSSAGTYAEPRRCV